LRALLLDFGGPVLRSPFELLDDLPRLFDFAPERLGELTWHGPFDLDRDWRWRAFQAGEMTEREYWTVQNAELGRLVGRPLSTLESFTLLYGQPEERVVRPEAIDAIRRVRADGVPIGVLTNDLSAFHPPEWIEAAEVLKLVDHLVDCSTLGFLKPDPRSYAAAIDALGVAPADIVFLDDQPANVRGGLDAGLDARWFDITNPTAAYASL
jgi:putative hydrolase of the HAD superfamily